MKMNESFNQNIKPSTTKINSKGNLEIGGCDLTELADKYGTPLYIIDEKTIRGILKQYKKAFESYKNISMLYASKALMTTAIARIISDEGFGFDAVSSGELYTIAQSGCDMRKVLFNGNNKSSEEIQMAIELGIGRFSVDNFLELSLLNTIAESFNKKVDILLRITPGIECHTHEYIQTGHLDSKFGFDLTQIDEAIELINEEYKFLNLHGLHAHIGSQIFELKSYEDEVKVVLSELKRINEKYSLSLNEVNLGGGLGVKYVENDMPPSINDIAAVIIKTVQETAKELKIELPKLYIEPGRSVVATAGITLYTVGSSKQVPKGKKYVAVDGGMADNPRPSMYQAQYFAEVVNAKDNDDEEKVTIAGRFCESGDILIKDIILPKLEEGDIICVYNTGAYGYSMSSNYNRVLKPAMVLVNNSQSDIIIERETFQHLTKLDIIPNRLK